MYVYMSIALWCLVCNFVMHGGSSTTHTSRWYVASKTWSHTLHVEVTLLGCRSGIGIKYYVRSVTWYGWGDSEIVWHKYSFRSRSHFWVRGQISGLWLCPTVGDFQITVQKCCHVNMTCHIQDLIGQGHTLRLKDKYWYNILSLLCNNVMDEGK